jgi:formamidopyrimidine-DNA glycosylase
VVPELPEVEVLVRHLKPLVTGKTIRAARVLRPKVLLPTSIEQFCKTLRGATFMALSRRGKYLIFELQARTRKGPLHLLGHLGMTGRIYLSEKAKPLPKHTAVVLDLGRENLVFEDTRYFGRLTLDTGALTKLGPEPLDERFTVKAFAQALQRSAQPIKIKLLDQSLVAGLGNIYVSEALFQAGISPKLAARQLKLDQIRKLRLAMRRVLARAIRCGSTVPLNYDGAGGSDGLFYFGRAPGTPDFYEERLQVYDRAGQPCPNCGTGIRRIVQAARSTFYCPACQSRRRK